MSIQTLSRGHQLASDARPLVQPSRRRLDWRFPSVAFTVTTDLPWVEVLLTTDPALLDPAKAASRTPATFYASRSDGGLTPTVGGRARYVAPSAVVERLASGGSIWYVALAYADASGMGGIASASTGASGVVTVDRPRRVSDRVHRRRRSPSLTRALVDGAAEDRRDGEDGADLPAPTTGPAAAAGTYGARGRALAADDRLAGEDGADLQAASVPPRTAAMALGPSGAAVPVQAPWSQSPSGPAKSYSNQPRRSAEHPFPARPVATAPGTPVQPAGHYGSPGSNGWPVGGTFTPAAPSGNPADPQPTSTLSLADYDDDYDDARWDRLDGATVPALGTSPALTDEYPSIVWGDVQIAEAERDRPAYLSLEGGVADYGPASGTRRVVPVLPAMELKPETQRRIIEIVAGSDGAAYSAVNADGPYRGRHGPGHKAYQRYHTGLAFGIAEFGQDSDTLGQLLSLMHDRDPETFASVFGPAADALLAVTTAPGPSGEHVDGDRGPRVQPVDGADLWEEPWLSRFRAAGEVPAFRAAQNQLAAELFLAPLLPVAAGFGLVSERALAMVLDRAFVLGEQGAKRWLADTVSPARTHTQRHAALAALGYDTVEAFQAAVPGLLTDGEFGPMTQATLAAALRALGPATPLPVPDLQQAVEAMVRRARGEEGSARLVRLATAPDLTDGPVGG